MGWSSPATGMLNQVDLTFNVEPVNQENNDFENNVALTWPTESFCSIHTNLELATSVCGVLPSSE